MGGGNMNSFYALAGRLIDYYRRKKLHDGNEAFSVKCFCKDETGKSICSFPTYKRIAQGETVKNEGFYYFLANRLKLSFDVPSHLEKDFIGNFEKAFCDVILNFQFEKVRGFCAFYEEKFSQMGTGIVMAELKECLALLKKVCLGEVGTINEDYLWAIIHVTQSSSFAIQIYLLLYFYEICYQSQAKKALEILEAAHACPGNDLSKACLEALYLRDVLKDEKKMQAWIFERLDGDSLKRRFLVKYIQLDRLSAFDVEDVLELLKAVKASSQIFPKAALVWLYELLARYYYSDEQYMVAMQYAQDGLVCQDGKRTLLMLIYLSCTSQLELPLKNLPLDHYFEAEQIGWARDYFHSKQEEDFKACEVILTQKVLPYLEKKSHHDFVNYLFYQELLCCTQSTGHQTLLDKVKGY